MSPITILDGGFSTQLSLVTGEDINGDPLWCARYLATNPDAVLKTHLDFLNAGAEVIITNSYQASIDGFMEYLGMDEKSSYDLMKKSVRIARQAVKLFMEKNPKAKEPKIAGSIGPYGASLHDGSEYTGDYVDTVHMDSVLDWHMPRLSALIDEGVDFLAIETIPALAEAEGLMNLVKNYPDQKVWLSFQCKDDQRIAHGENFKEAARKCWELNRSQLVAVGCNCLNPKFVHNLLSSVNEGYEKQNHIPFVVYPNSGEEFSPITGWSGKIVQRGYSLEFINDWLELGVKYIGGCCRTDAEHVKNIKETVNKWESTTA